MDLIMGNINLKKRNLCLVIGFLTFFLMAVYQRHSNNPPWYSLLGLSSFGPLCNYRLLPFSKESIAPSNSRLGHDSIKPVGILGPPGSGVLWLRFIIEQLTGILTGSAEIVDSSLFKADGQITKVLAVMTYRSELLPTMHSAIVIYRDMRETVRARYTELHGPSGGTNEVPIKEYYGKHWQTFALDESRSWAQSYRSYVESGSPLLVVNYDELTDRRQIETHLLRFANFFRVPVKHSTLRCVIERSERFPLKPPAQRADFDPFSLLAHDDLAVLKNLENETLSMIEHARRVFRPKV